MNKIKISITVRRNDLIKNACAVDVNNHEVILGTGSRVSLITSAAVLYLLEQLVNGTPEDREILFQLRKACIADSPVKESFRHSLSEMIALGDDGKVDPAVRDIVRAAVHGEVSGLYLISPYTNPWDRALSDLIISKEKVRGVLPPDQAETMIRETSGTKQADSQTTSWLDFIKRRKDPNSGYPPPSSN